MSELKVYLFGPPRVERDGTEIEIRGHKILALMSYLVATRQSHSRQALATLLWPEYDQSRARANLRRELSRLKGILGAKELVITRNTVALTPDGRLISDIQRFRNLLTACHQHEHRASMECSECFRRWMDAAELYRAEFLAGFSLPDCPAYDEWQFFEAEELRQELAWVLDKLIQWQQEHAQYESAIAHARRLLNLDPLDESSHQRLIRLFWLDNQRTSALRQYQICERLLREELGVQPSAETIALMESFANERERQQSDPAMTADTNQGRTGHLNTSPSRLPREQTPLIGRQIELNALKALLVRDDVRLISIVGPGGVGKSRLALRLAHECRPAGADGAVHFPDGIFYVALSSVQSADQLVAALADALNLPLETGAHQRRNPLQQVGDYLRYKQVLLICDNFEHLLSHADLLSNLLDTASQLKIVVTTREALRLQEEHLIRLNGLRYPEEEHDPEKGPDDLIAYPAIKLFRQCALQLNQQDVTTDLINISRICRAVDGVPLAIELAAGWVDTLSIAEIATEITANLDLLETELRNIPERHRSMRTVFDSAWQRLNDYERRLFARLSFFRGGFTRDAAQEIAGTSLMSLSTLVKRSLLNFDAESGRYSLHELLRQYAEERLNSAELFTQSEADRFKEEFTAYYLSMLSQHLPDLKSSHQKRVLVALDRDLDNISHAWRLAAAKQELQRMYSAMDTLAFFFLQQGRYQEGLPIWAQIADQTYGYLTASEQKVLARVLIWQSVFFHRVGDLAAAQQSLQQAGTHIDHALGGGIDVRPEQALLLLQRGDIALRVDFSFTMSAYAQSLSICRALDEPWEVARVLTAMGWALIEAGDYERARTLLEEGLDIQQTLNDPLSQATTLESLSLLARYRGDVVESERLALEGLQICRELANRAGRARMLSNYGAALIWIGRADLGRDALKESIRIFRDLGDLRPLANAEFRLAAAYIHLGEYDQAEVTAQQSYAHAVELENDEDAADALRVLGEAALVLGQYERAYDALSKAVAIFKQVGATPMQGKVLATQALAERVLGDLPGARRQALEALSIGVERSDYLSTLDSLATIAVLLADEGDIARAIELYGIVRRALVRKNHRFLADVVGSVIIDAAGSLPPAEVEAIRSNAQSLNLWTEAIDVQRKIRESSLCAQRFAVTPHERQDLIW